MDRQILSLDESVEVTKLRPLADHVLIRIIDREKTSGGIFLPRHDATELVVGEVLAIGSGILDPGSGRVFPIELAPGDIVLTMKFMGQEAQSRESDYRLVREHGIWAKVTLKDRDTYEFSSIEPRFACLVVEPRDETRTKSGLLFIANANDRLNAGLRAKVVHVGPGSWHGPSGKRLPLDFKPGDEVVMVRYAGSNVEVNGRQLRILQEVDVRFILEDGDAE